jgi:hypothetical protein
MAEEEGATEGAEPPAPSERKASKPTAPAERPRETPTVVAVLLASAAVVAAVIGARAALLGDEGSDTWHSAVREDVKRGAALVEDVRFVYSEEAQLGFQVAEGRVRAEEARRAAADAGELGRALLETHAGAQTGIADTVAPSSSLAKDPEYELEDGGYDVLRRLVERRSETPELTALDPDETEQRGTDLNAESALLVASALPAALAFMCGALAHGFPSRRRWLVPAGFALTAISLVLAIVLELAN